MNQKSLGPLSVTPLALGCMSFHDEATGRAVIDAAWAAGIRFFDTADLYDHGQNEAIVGKVLRDRRQDCVIATKVGNRWRSDGSGWDWVPRKAYILDAVENSLRRLGTDYIDLYQLHGGTIDDPLDEVVTAFEQLQQDGKIRAYGISSIRPNTIRQWTGLSNGSSCMSQYSLLDRRPEEFILPHLVQKGTGLLVRGALAKGLLVAKPVREYLGHSADTVASTQQLMAGLVGTDNLPGLAIDYVLQSPAVSSVVLGASSAVQISTAVATWERVRTMGVDYAALGSQLPVLRYDNHR